MGTDYGGDLGHIVWTGSMLRLLDQRRLPREQCFVDCASAAAVAAAVRDMVVRGAPAIGIAAAYGAVLAAREATGEDGRLVQSRWAGALRELAAARPTAVNLAWALARMRALAIGHSAADLAERLEQEALRLHRQDVADNRRMGELGSALIGPSAAVITHCNAGTLATGGYGTALGVIRSGVRAGNITRVFAGETRPWLQGARLTAWELAQDGIDVTLVCEGGMGSLMREAGPAWIIVGADRIAANGDVANKVGTYNLALLARAHGARTMVVAPTSTIDAKARSGDDVTIEQRAAAEVLDAAGYVAPVRGLSVWNPVFDITPAALVDVIVTERGVARPPFRESLAQLLARVGR